MEYSHEHLELQRNLKRFIETDINPYVDEWEAAEIFPAKEVFRKLGALGMLGVSKPVEFGGLGLDYSYSMAMAEALGHIRCGGVPMAIGVQTDMATPALARFGSDALRREFLAPAISGEAVACVGVSEPGAGSDVAAIRTTARKDGGDYIINGSKMWITNSLQADWMCLLAITSDGPAHRNKSLIIVPMDTPGISVGKKIRKIGMNSSDTGLIHFDEVRVPQRFLVGEEDKGFTYQMLQFQEERLWCAANIVQQMQNCIDATIDYTRERKIFGASVLDNQWVHFKLAEMQTELESLRAMTYRACGMYIGGADVTELASMAKLKAGRLARQITDGCMQFWGGMGFTLENPVSQFYRDGRLTSIGGGADEVMLGIICKYMDILPGRKA
ncbi:acyl-CoA dehydrogenase family protein [Pseudoduganella sp. S-14]|uniref:acyl-CoA dehydrogenase family protein n=1 Tax=Pseudoduganella sp. S-14 TaxID=3404065 RepID=UPI003CF630AC